MKIHLAQNSAPPNLVLDTKTITSLHKYIADSYPRDGESTSRLYKKGDWIYQTGQPSTRIYEIVTGVVRTSTLTKEGDEVTLDVLTHNHLFGNLGVWNTPFTGNAKALIDTQIRLYDRLNFSNLKTKDSIINAWFNAYILHRCNLLENRLLLFSSRQTKTKVDLLYELFDMEVYDTNCKSYSLLYLLTQKDLADLVGTTRQTLAMALKKMGYKR